MQNVAPSQLADRELFDFETLSLDRDNDERLFEGDNIQAGQTDSLAEIGLPVSPKTQTFNPKFASDKPYPAGSENAAKNERAAQKIPTINPVI
jgi:tRNA 2-thiocytidine biosynthesis protein TtcA